MRKKMFYGATNLIFDKARNLRKNSTHAELVLWEYLKQKPLGFKFRRQHPLGIYIADFYCHALGLVIEIDGSIHNKVEIKEQDIVRQKNIENDGLYVLRFTNDEVILKLEEVMNKIENYIINNKAPL